MDNMNIKIKLYLYFLIILCLFGFFYAFFTSSFWGNQIGKYLFLHLHLNRPAILVLENSKKDWQTHFLLGRIYFVEGKLMDSVNAYIESIELNPNHKESYYGRGLSYGFMGHKFLTQAENDFEKYIELDEEDFKRTGLHAYGAWAGYNDLAWIHFLKGDFEQQELITRAGLEISSQNPWLLNSLGVALLAQNKCGQAKEYFNSSEKLLNDINVKQFGEAYSGDSQHFWETGLENMRGVIGENLQKCKL